jgi:hypothetical protein
VRKPRWFAKRAEQNGKNNERAGAPRPLPKSIVDLAAAGIRVVVAIPMERHVSDHAFLAFWEIARKGWPIMHRLYGRTDVHRNIFADQLLQSDFTHLIMLDSDHIHPVDVVEKLVRWVWQDPSRLVIGGLHFRRGEPFEPCAFIYGSDGQLYAPAEWQDGLIQVDALGHGTLLVSRKVFEAIPPPWWAYDYSQVVERRVFPSEDLWFCRLCREHGITMWCDTTLTSPHLINNIVDADTFQRWIADHPDMVKPRNEMHLEMAEAAATQQGLRIPDMVTRVGV